MSVTSKTINKAFITIGKAVEIGFENKTKKAAKTNIKVLNKILKLNSKTEIGKLFDFKSINSVEDYKNKVPITDYKFYEQYIKKMAHGKKNVLTSDDIQYFGHTSGTTGNQKLIPVTKKSMMKGSKYMMFLVNTFCYENFKQQYSYGKGVLIADIVTTSYTSGNIPICSATSGGIKYVGKVIQQLYTSPIEVMKIEDKESALYLHILFALKERNLKFISSVFISSVLDFFRLMEKHKDDLIKDIQRGTINRSLLIDDKLRKKINLYLKPDAIRADELSNIFEKGFNACARRIWPNLIYILTVTGASFSIYNDKVNYYTNYLPIYSPMYAATESTIGINNEAERIKYILIPDTAFYEFIPIKDYEKKLDSNIQTKCIEELKIGEKYEVVLTNYAGLYRYKLGDVIRVVGFHNNSPEIVFEYRVGQLLNMTSEKTNELQLVSAIRNVRRIFNLNIVDYITEPDNTVTPGRYIIYIELSNKIDKMKLKRIEKHLDIELSRSNPAYDRARYNFKLSKLKVVILKQGTFSKIQEALYYKGVSKNQIKIPRVINRYSIKKIVHEGQLLL